MIFCEECGTKLDHATSVAPERRHVTILFCDLVGSTALSGQLDPEDLRDVLRAYQKACADAIEGHHGYVAQYLGDGLLAYFGYPAAHEDDAIRAVRAGLDVVNAVEEIRPRIAQDYAAILRVRVGLHTGLVVAGEMGAGEHREAHTAVGETPNLAARLQNLAQPDEVVISDATRRLVQGFFTVHHAGRHELKGISQPQEVWRVVGQSKAATRIDALAEKGLTPLVGRAGELEFLRQRWDRACRGAGQLVLIRAEAGVGKSRLIAAFQQTLGKRYTAVRYFCSAHHKDSPLFPLIRELERAAGFERSEPAAARLAKLQAWLDRIEAPRGDRALIADLLSLPDGGHASPEVGTVPQAAAKQHRIAALVRYLECMSGSMPVLLIFEDVHWIDPTSLEFLDAVVARLAQRPILILVTFRPEFEAPWAGRPDVGILELARMRREDMAAMVASLAGAAALPAATVNTIVARSDGVPLFIEELTKAVVEAAAAPGSESANAAAMAALIPETLQASLLARLDRLGHATKQTAQVASVLGREFPFELLRHSTAMDESSLRACLDRLLRVGLLVQRDTVANRSYAFNHALVQDAAYASLVREQRRAIHGRIADALASAFSTVAAGTPEIVALHLEAAGRLEPAIHYWRRAGELALRRSSVIEAKKHFESALRLIDRLPAGSARLAHERGARLQLGLALQILKGPASTECYEQYALAEALARSLPVDREAFMATWGLWLHFNVRGLVKEGLSRADELLDAAQRLGDADLMLEAYHARLPLLTFQGQVTALGEAVKEVRARYDRARHGDHAQMFGGHDSLVCARSFNSIALWLNGAFAGSLDEARAAIKYARELDHAFSVAHAFSQSALTFLLLRHRSACREAASEIISIAERHQFAWPLTLGRFIDGWVISGDGEHQAGVERMTSAALHANSGNRRSWMLAIIAQLEIAAGRLDAAREALDHARRIAEQSGARLFEAEIERLRGEILLRSGEASGAEAHFAAALATSRQQSARGFELRAATSLARVWRARRRAEASDLLAPIYRALATGLDTPDLAEARLVLDELR